VTTRPPYICLARKHLHRAGVFGEDAGRTCNAYPDGIPEPILYETFDHRRPFGGERDGLLFEL